jgi:flagellar hook-associated protein 3 FlgL
MRLNPNSASDYLRLIDNAKMQEASALKQLSSGRRVTLPSEDPAAIASSIADATRLRSDDQYIESVSTVRDAVSVADSALSSVVIALQRAITLGVEGGTGTQSAANRLALAEEVKGITAEVLSVANLSYRGGYLFSGTATSQPFVADPLAPAGFRFDGNDHQITVRVTESLTVQANVPGSRIFSAADGDVFKALADLQHGLETNDPVAIQKASVAARNAMDRVVASRTVLGNIMNQLDSCKQFLDAEQLNLKSRENTLVGADPEKAASELAQAQIAHQAVLQSIARQTRLNLLDYLSY